MSGKIGKLTLQEFDRYITGKLGAPNPRVLVPPQLGVDAGVIDVGNGNVLVVAEDPIFPAPGLGLETFGWFTVHIGASDVAVMGVKPQFMTYSLLMPPATPDADVQTIVTSIHQAALELEIAIVGGHTGYYPAVNLPIIGGITVFSLARRDQIITPAGANAGDVVVLTKGPAVETAALLSILYRDRLAARYPLELVNAALQLHRQVTCVEDALIGARWGATAMHDATEGGVIGGLFEICHASGKGMVIREADFVYPPEIRMVCEGLAIDPLRAIAEGSLLICLPSSQAPGLLGDLEAGGIAASIIGEVVADTGCREIHRRDGSIEPLAIPDVDPFWPAFFAGLKGASAEGGPGLR